jgi:hypothetical protein
VLRAELSCLRPIEVRQSDNLVTAATIGWRRPAVLLPADWTSWTADQRRAVLAHEIAHARSQDFLGVLLGQLALVLHFYHPLVHWLTGRLRLEQELAADAAAASVSGGQRQYLMTIAELALRQQDRPLLWPARSFLPTRTTFLRRIAMLRDSKLRFDRLSPVARWTTVGTVLLCGVLVAGLRGPSGPSPVLAEEPAKPVVAEDAIDTSYMIDGAASIVVMRPAAVFARSELAALAMLLEQSGNVVPPGTRLADVRQIMAILPEADIPSGPREIKVLQWVKPVAEKSLRERMPNIKDTGKEYNGKRIYVSSPGGPAFLVCDDYTVVEAGSEQAMNVYLAGKQGRLPKWLPAKAWESFRADHFVIVADTGMMRRDMKGLVGNSPPIVRAVFASMSPVWDDTTALAAGAKLDNRLAAHAWAATKDADSSEKLRRTAEALKTLVQSAVRNTRTTVQSGQRPDRTTILAMLDTADGLLDNLKLRQEGSEVKLETSVGMDRVPLNILLPPIAAARQSAQQMQAANNMKQLALAMHNYAEANRRFPPAVLYGPDGKTQYSWRVALLPYLEADIYKQYHFDEPWDGPNNRKLLEKMPAVFRCPAEPAESQNSSYFALVGPGAIFDTQPRKKVPDGPAGLGAGGAMGGPAAAPAMPGGAGGPMPGAGGTSPARWPEDAPLGTTFMEITDGVSNTILLVEAKRNIPWTKPEDIPYDPDKPLPKLGGHFDGGFVAAMADGSVHVLSSTASEKVLRLLITKADRQPVSVEDAKTPAQPPKPADAMTKQGMMTLVEDFFQHNYRDITWRETVEWGKVAKTADGNFSIRYKYRAKIWNGEPKTFNKIFTFSPKGQWVSTDNAEKVPPGPPARVYQVGKKVSDFPEREDLTTPEAAFASIYRAVATEGDAAWPRLSVPSLAGMMSNQTPTKLSKQFADRLLNTKIIEVHVWDKIHAAVITDGGTREFHIRAITRVDNRWLNEGEDVAGSIEAARAHVDRMRSH